MLVELGIRNFAIIDELRIEFDSGLNALTGETGAGKSIVIDALGAVLGDRIGPDVVRSGAASAQVEAIFDIGARPNAQILALVEDFGVDIEDGSIILSRQITAGGRSTGRINGTTVTINQLNQIGSLMIDIHGQSDHLKLLRPAEQLDALDHFAGTHGLRAEVGETVKALHAIRNQRMSLRTNQREREQRIDLLRYQIDEISAAALEPGEFERVERERAILMNAERLVGDAATALAALEPDDGTGAVSMLATATGPLQRVA